MHAEEDYFEGDGASRPKVLDQISVPVPEIINTSRI
jgi:hypothetical protein